MTTKPLLTSPESLITQLEKIGVQFTKISREEAKEILSNRSYYYKLSRYKYNFPQAMDGTFTIDFAHLVDFFEIDTTLRYYLLTLALDVEHAIKSTLLHDIMTQTKIDEYDLLQQFKEYTNDYITPIMKSIQQNDYLNDAYLDDQDSMPIWIFIECCSFSVLEKFVEFYQTRYPSKRLITAAKLLPFARHIRNACAHNNVLLMNVYKKRNKLPISTTMKSYAHAYHVPLHFIEQRKLHDIFSLIVLHKKYCSHLSQDRYQALQPVITRLFKNNQDYAAYPSVQKLFQTLKQLLEKVG